MARASKATKIDPVIMFNESTGEQRRVTTSEQYDKLLDKGFIWLYDETPSGYGTWEDDEIAYDMDLDKSRGDKMKARKTKVKKDDMDVSDIVGGYIGDYDEYDTANEVGSEIADIEGVVSLDTAPYFGYGHDDVDVRVWLDEGTDIQTVVDAIDYPDVVDLEDNQDGSYTFTVITGYSLRKSKVKKEEYPAVSKLIQDIAYNDTDYEVINVGANDISVVLNRGSIHNMDPLYSYYECDIDGGTVTVFLAGVRKSKTRKSGGNMPYTISIDNLDDYATVEWEDGARQTIVLNRGDADLIRDGADPVRDGWEDGAGNLVCYENAEHPVSKKFTRKGEERIPVSEDDTVEIEEMDGERYVEIEPKDEHAEEVATGYEQEGDDLNTEANITRPDTSKPKKSKVKKSYLVGYKDGRNGDYYYYSIDGANATSWEDVAEFDNEAEARDFANRMEREWSNSKSVIINDGFNIDTGKILVFEPFEKSKTPEVLPIEQAIRKCAEYQWDNKRNGLMPDEIYELTGRKAEFLAPMVRTNRVQKMHCADGVMYRFTIPRM